MSHTCPLGPAATATISSVMVLKSFGSFCNVLFSYCRKVHPHGNHYSTMITHPQPFLTNQMTMSTHQPINIGIAHVVWPQPAANKRVKPCVNRCSTEHGFYTSIKIVSSPFLKVMLFSLIGAISPKQQTSKMYHASPQRWPI